MNIRAWIAALLIVPTMAWGQTLPSPAVLNLSATGTISAPAFVGALTGTASGNATTGALTTETSRATAAEAGKVPTGIASGVNGGSVDASATITAGLTANVSLILPCGTYRLDSAPAIPANAKGIRGVSPGCVQLNVNFATGDVFHPTGAGGNARFEMADLTIYAIVTRTSGAMVHVDGTYGATLRNVAFDGPRYTDVLVDGANTTKIIDSDFRPGATYTCVTLTGTGTQAVETVISRTNLSGCGTGLYILNASGVYLDRMDIVGSQNGGVWIYPTAASSQAVNAVRAVNVMADTTRAGNGWTIGGDGQVSEIHIDYGWGASSGQPASGPFSSTYAGLLANNPTLDGVQISNFYGWHNGGPGIDIEAGKNIQINSPMACMNGAYGSNLYDGIVVGSAVDNITITSPTSGLCGYGARPGTVTNFQRYGMNIDNNATQNVTVIGGQFPGNLTGTWVKYAGDANLRTAATPP